MTNVSKSPMFPTENDLDQDEIRNLRRLRRTAADSEYVFVSMRGLRLLRLAFHASSDAPLRQLASK